MSKLSSDGFDSPPNLSLVDQTTEFFFGLKADLRKDREQFVERIFNHVKEWLHFRDVDDHAHKLLKVHLPNILRLGHECPYDDVQHRFSIFLHDLQRECQCKVPRLVRLGPSAFIPPAEVVPISSAGEGSPSMFMEAFLNDCRVSHMVQLMGFHPAYMDSFVKTHHFMMRGDGPLPPHWRNYIAIMAGARHFCGYLVSFQELEFLENCRDDAWRQDMTAAPKKLKNLAELNKILCHQPWLVEPGHMEELLKPGQDSWSMSELVHALVLMAHFHALSGFALGCGVNPEVDTDLGHTWEAPVMPEWSVSDAETASPASSCASTIVPACSNSLSTNGMPIFESSSPPATASSAPSASSSFQDIFSSPTIASPPSPIPPSDAAQERLLKDMFERMNLVRSSSESTLTVEDCQEQFETESLLSCELEPPPVQVGRSQCPYPEWIERFIDERDFVHEDFALRGEFSGIMSFRYHDYSWEGHGFSLVNRLYSDVGVLLDEKFQCVSTLTYNTFGDKADVDTTPIRRAIWNYIHCIKGIFHDDYAYSEVNKLLPRTFKSYIKNVTCFPERVGFMDFFNCLRGFKHSEQVHINILLMEARFQAELLYALRALNRYITLVSRS